MADAFEDIDLDDESAALYRSAYDITGDRLDTSGHVAPGQIPARDFERDLRRLRARVEQFGEFG